MKKFVAKHDLGKLAPIAAEILLWNEMEQKIGTESGTGVYSKLTRWLQNFNINILTYGT